MKRNFTRIFAGIAIICLLVGAMPMLEASAGSAPAISASGTAAEVGSSVDVVITLTDNPGIWSVGLKVGYDHTALTLTGVTAGEIFTAGECTPPPSLNDETYFFLASRDDLTDTTANGTLVTLTFSVAADAAYQGYPISLELSGKNTINVNDNEVAFDTMNGLITAVPETVTITFDTAGGSEVAALTGNIGAAVTGPANPTRAGYAFAGWSPAIPAVFPDESVTITAQWVLLGDVNGNGSVAAVDALMALQASSGRILISGIQTLAADVNSNGSVSPLDALMILQYSAGKITSFS